MMVGDGFPIFIDTSLDTHLVMVITDSETVSRLKEKIVHEHKLCFVDVGDIEINSVKIERKGVFYHLSDHMFVKDAFDGVGKSWLLSVDAVRKEERGKNQTPENPLAIMNNPIVDGENILMVKAALEHDAVQPHAKDLSSDAPVKKKRKTENSKHNEKSTIDDTVELTSADGGHINGTVTLHSSMAPAPEDAHVSFTKMKRKKKKRSASTLDQVVHAVQDSKNDVGGVSLGVTLKESDTELTFGERINGALKSGPKEKLCASLQEMEELDNNKNDAVYEEYPVNVAESTREKSKKKKKKRDSSSEKYHIAFRNNNAGISDEKTTGAIEPGETITIDHSSEKAMVDENIMQPTEGTETKTLDASHSILESKNDTSTLNVVADAEIVRDEKKKKRHEDTPRKSKRAKELAPFAVGHTQGTLVDNSSTQSHEAKGHDNMVELSQGTEKKSLDASVTDNVIQNVLESLRQGDENDGHEREVQAGDFDNTDAKRSLSKDDDENIMLQSNKKLLEVSLPSSTQEVRRSYRLKAKSGGKDVGESNCGGGKSMPLVGKSQPT